MDIYIYIYMDTYGYKWIHMDTYGCTWKHIHKMDTYGGLALGLGPHMFLFHVYICVHVYPYVSICIQGIRMYIDTERV